MKSPPHLELCVIPLFLERVDAEERRFIRSAPQNAILSHAAQGSQTQGFQNHIPARGRKLGSIFRNIRKTAHKFSKPHPRKGTETISSRISSTMESSNISKPHPRKGTETLVLRPYDQTSPALISKPHPRKGTETLHTH